MPQADIFDWFESDEICSIREARRILGPALAWAEQSGVIVSASRAMRIRCPNCSLVETLPLHRRGSVWRVNCSEDGWIDVDDDFVWRRRVDVVEFAGQVSRTLGIAGLPKARASGNLIELGGLMFEGHRRVICIARRLDDGGILAEVLRILDSAVEKNAGLILAAHDFDPDFQSARGHRFANIRHAMQIINEGIRIDYDFLRLRAQGLPPAEQGETRPWRDLVDQIWKQRETLDEILNKVGLEASTIMRLGKMEWPLAGWPASHRTVEAWIRARHDLLFPDKRRRKRDKA